MTLIVHWNGTEQEASDLFDALASNCACQNDYKGDRIKTCVAHHAFVHEQRWLDGLLFERWRVDELKRQEWCLPKEVD